MTRQTGHLLVSVAVGIIMGYYSTSLAIKAAVEKAPVVISVVLAALFVRLARGTPQFPFEKLELEKSNRILASFVYLRKLYSHAFIILVITLISSIIYSASIENFNSIMVIKVLSGCMIFLLGWSLSLAYSIYSTDIVLFKAHTEAMQSVVDDLSAKQAEETKKAVNDSFKA